MTDLLTACRASKAVLSFREPAAQGSDLRVPSINSEGHLSAVVL